MEVQLCSCDGYEFFETVSEAYHKTNTKYIDKISFTDAEGMHRFIPKQKKDLWNPKSEAKMKQLSDAYRVASLDEIFWIDQPMDKFVDLVKKKENQRLIRYFIEAGHTMVAYIEQYKHLLDIETIDEDDCYAGAITNILTVKEFEEKYNC